MPVAVSYDRIRTRYKRCRARETGSDTLRQLRGALKPTNDANSLWRRFPGKWRSDAAGAMRAAVNWLDNTAIEKSKKSRTVQLRFPICVASLIRRINIASAFSTERNRHVIAGFPVPPFQCDRPLLQRLILFIGAECVSELAHDIIQAIEVDNILLIKNKRYSSQEVCARQEAPIGLLRKKLIFIALWDSTDKFSYFALDVYHKRACLINVAE